MYESVQILRDESRFLLSLFGLGRQPGEPSPVDRPPRGSGDKVALFLARCRAVSGRQSSRLRLLLQGSEQCPVQVSKKETPQWFPHPRAT